MTGNDVWDGACVCAGQPMDCNGVIGGSAFIDLCGNCAGGDTGVDPNPDTDLDAILYCFDNCIDIANPLQGDLDGDGIGNPCDNCPWDYNPDQTDLNGNGVGDLCEGGVGIEENNGIIWSIHPNPTRGMVVLSINDARIAEVLIFNMLGELVFSAPSGAQSYDISFLASGSYMVLLSSDEGELLGGKRLVKH